MAILVLFLLALLSGLAVIWTEGRFAEVAVALLSTFVGLLFVLGIVDWLVIDAVERRNERRNQQIRETLRLHLAYMVNRAMPEGVPEIDGVIGGLRATSPDLPELLATYWETVEAGLIAALIGATWATVSDLTQRTHVLLPQLLWLSTISQDAVDPDCVAEIVDAYSRLDSAERSRASDASAPPATAVAFATDFVLAVRALARAHRTLAR